jgi:hypothetical protein
MNRHCSFLRLISELLVYMKMPDFAGVECGLHGRSGGFMRRDTKALWWRGGGICCL